MKDAFRRFILGICAALALLAFSGCTQHEHRKVKVTEEQHESEVVEEARGQEMIVE